MFARTLRRQALPALVALLGAAAAFPASAQTQLIAPPWRPPVLIVAGAGQPVRLSALRLDVDIAAGVAMTRVEMQFTNPNNRTLEGKLQFPLAPGQIVSGFALDVDGKLRDAVPVEKARGQQVFEDIARRGVDPGLLQTTVGNNYELRIYPFNPGKTRTVVLTLLEPASTRLQIPLGYAAKVDRFELKVRSAAALAPVLAGSALPSLRFEPVAAGGSMARLAANDMALPAQPLTLTWPADARALAEAATGERAGATYFTASLPVPVRTSPRPLPRRVEIVWDASASSAHRQFDREFALLDAYFQRARNIEVGLVRVADTAAPPERFIVRDGDWSVLRKALAATVYDGASNLGAVRHDGRAAEALWFSDGLANYGPAWHLDFPVPVYAINSAASSDPAALQALAQSTGGRSIDLGTLSRQAAADALLQRGTDAVGISAVGAADLVIQPESAATGRVVIAGRLTDRSADVTIELRDAAGTTTQRRLHVDATRNPTPLAALQWARLTLASLAGEAHTHRARIRELGRRFGLATSETSLIVLEQASDYVRYEIEPPSELRAAYDRLAAVAVQGRKQTESQHLADVVQRWQARVDWWQRDFPKGAPPAAIAVVEPLSTDGRAVGVAPATMRSLRREASAGNDAIARESAPPARPLSVAPPPAPSPAVAPTSAMPMPADAEKSRDRAAKASGDGRSAAAASITIALTPASRGSAALKRLRSARPADRLPIYLDERSANASNVGFFLDAAEFFLAQGDRATGLRVLSNLAELDLQNRDVLRLLGYHLQQAGEAALAVPIFERVLELAPHEPQSQRDLGLALAAAGQPQAAVDHLYDVVTGTWDARFPDIDLIALEELNAIAVGPQSGRGLDLSRIDKRLLKALPLDLRVVLAWDADNTDVDLHVIDPNGEEIFFSHPASYQGGAITRDATGGYGPEEFALRVAKPGKYRVEANFFGHRQQVLTSSTGLMLWLSTGFATPAQQDRRTTVRVASERGERVVVGEFEVKAVK